MRVAHPSEERAREGRRPSKDRDGVGTYKHPGVCKPVGGLVGHWAGRDDFVLPDGNRVEGECRDGDRGTSVAELLGRVALIRRRPVPENNVGRGEILYLVSQGSREARLRFRLVASEESVNDRLARHRVGDRIV